MLKSFKSTHLSMANDILIFREIIVLFGDRIISKKILMFVFYLERKLCGLFNLLCLNLPVPLRLIMHHITKELQFLTKITMYRFN